MGFRFRPQLGVTLFRLDNGMLVCMQNVIIGVRASWKEAISGSGGPLGDRLEA